MRSSTFTDEKGVVNISDSESEEEENGERKQTSIASNAKEGVTGASPACDFAGTTAGIGKGKDFVEERGVEFGGDGNHGIACQHAEHDNISLTTNELEQAGSVSSKEGGDDVGVADVALYSKTSGTELPPISEHINSTSAVSGMRACGGGGMYKVYALSQSDLWEETKTWVDAMRRVSPDTFLHDLSMDQLTFDIWHSGQNMSSHVMCEITAKLRQQIEFLREVPIKLHLNGKCFRWRASSLRAVRVYVEEKVCLLGGSGGKSAGGSSAGDASPFEIFYYDNEEDTIFLESEMDFEEAVQLMRVGKAIDVPIKIHVRWTNRHGDGLEAFAGREVAAGDISTFTSRDSQQLTGVDRLAAPQGGNRAAPSAPKLSVEEVAGGGAQGIAAIGNVFAFHIQQRVATPVPRDITPRVLSVAGMGGESNCEVADDDEMDAKGTNVIKTLVGEERRADGNGKDLTSTRSSDVFLHLQKVSRGEDPPRKVGKQDVAGDGHNPYVTHSADGLIIDHTTSTPIKNIRPLMPCVWGAGEVSSCDQTKRKREMLINHWSNGMQTDKMEVEGQCMASPHPPNKVLALNGLQGHMPSTIMGGYYYDVNGPLRQNISRLHAAGASLCSHGGSAPQHLNKIHGSAAGGDSGGREMLEHQQITLDIKCPEQIEKRIILTPDQAIHVHKMNSTKTKSTAGLLSAQYGVTAKATCDIWSHRSWEAATRPYSATTCSPSADPLLATASPQAVSSERRVLRVPDEFHSITAAIQIARPEDQIQVSAGHYMESLQLVDAVVDILGHGNMQHILLDAPAGTSALSQQGGYVRIRNMTLRSNGLAPTVRTQKGKLMIEGCMISGGKIGVTAENGCNMDIKRSDLCWCKLQGLYLGGTSVAVLESCSVYQNGGHGILVMQGATSIDMTNSKVSYNQGAALVIDQGATAKVQTNDLRYNMQGPCLVGVQSQHLVSFTNNLTT